MPLAIKPKDVLHEVLRVNLKTFGEQFNSFKIAIREGHNYNRLKSAQNKWKRRVVSVTKMSHFHF